MAGAERFKESLAGESRARKLLIVTELLFLSALLYAGFFIIWLLGKPTSPWNAESDA